MQSLIVLSVLGVAVFAGLAHGCSDKMLSCFDWAKKGLCDKSNHKDFMARNCPWSCDLCGGGSGGTGHCGYKPSTRIVGGTEASPGAWPWQAQIIHNNGFPFCGGTLVHPQWIVTAAHCVPGKSPSDIRVRLGAHYRLVSIGTEQDMEIEKIISHYSYKNPTSKAHDIAMIKLKKPAQLNKAVNLACMPGSSGRVAVSKMCWVTGFGRLATGGERPLALMQVQVPVVSDARCRVAYGSRIHDSMVCAGLDQGGKDSCQGDSGGPMVCEDNGRFYLEGVVSWGSICGAPGKYGVYARVRYLKQWIDKTMNSN